MHGRVVVYGAKREDRDCHAHWTAREPAYRSCALARAKRAREQLWRDESGDNVGIQEGKGEEEKRRPDVEHLRKVDGDDVVGFVACRGSMTIDASCSLSVSPRTTPPFQVTNPAKLARTIRYGVKEERTKPRLRRVAAPRE